MRVLQRALRGLLWRTVKSDVESELGLPPQTAHQVLLQVRG